MFEVGFTEIVLILGLALLVLGPEKLPGLAQKIGRWTGRARSMARQLRTQLEQEVTLEELSRSRPMQPGAAPTESKQGPADEPAPAQPDAWAHDPTPESSSPQAAPSAHAGAGDADPGAHSAVTDAPADSATTETKTDASPTKSTQ